MELASLLPLLEPWVVLVLLAMARAGGLLAALPSTSGKAVPRMVQVLVAVGLSIALVGIAAPPVLPGADPVSLAIAIAGEVGVGYVLGFVVQVTLAGVRIAGEIIGVEIGLSFSAVADPMNPGASTSTASLLGHLGIQLLFALQLDRALLYGLGHSVRAVPLGGSHFDGDTVAAVSEQFGDALVGALHLALPVLATVLTVKLALAVLARFVPRLQIFALAFGIALIAGLNALQASLPQLAHSVALQLQLVLVRLDRVIETLQG
ncbi:MAG: flagellar biosynthetic protein FliR [Nannocystaceae bacterium]|nr:flagellar biosynthetic protein FliR [Nannocystaceae bacterium]